MLTVKAPAKINLTLEVLGRRTDGYHEIRSVIQTIDFCDELQFESGPGLGYRSDLPGWDSEKSIINKAVQLVREITGTDYGVTISVKKHIPLASGLGGDSSDAAAVLKGLNSLWGLGLTTSRLHEMAAGLGSDVPFFLYGGTAFMAGRGETIAVLPPVNPLWVVLMVPDISRPENKTAQLYGRLTPYHYTDGQLTTRLVQTIRDGQTLSSDIVFNTFENVAFDVSGELAAYRRHILKIGALNVHLAGSGPTMFSVVRDHAAGKELCERLKTQGLQLYLTSTLSSADTFR